MAYSLLQKSLLTNATFSGACALTLFFASDSLSQWLGNVDDRILIGLGVSLAAFCTLLIWVALQSKVRVNLVKLITLSDWGWVLGTPIVIGVFYANISVVGVAILVAVASVVGLCAWFQQKGLALSY